MRVANAKKNLSQILNLSVLDPRSPKDDETRPPKVPGLPMVQAYVTQVRRKYTER